MGCELLSMHNFRASLLSEKDRSAHQPVQRHKQPRSPGGEGLERVAVPRAVNRTADHREDDRRRLIEQTVTLVFRGAKLNVDLINLSGGGAMICGDFSPFLWEKVELTLGEHGTVECAVRWIRGNRIGLEFAHETQVHGDPAARDAMLLEVSRSSFPDMPAAAPSVATELNDNAVPFDAARRGERSQPMIWSGHVHFNHKSVPVRLRNISPHGALVESSLAYPVGAGVYLALGEAGQMFATVSWSRGDQVGLSFSHAFDIASLSKSRPDLAPRRWSADRDLRNNQGDDSPWPSARDRLSLDALKTMPEAS
ncbi:MAG: PilZ domain-containing protein [Pseudomonadota bacterium]|nr:PilZ domain-containing protein [Pseudomonadota bacterium]